MSQDLNNDLLKALLTATYEQKEAALQMLRGEEQESLPDPEPFLTLRDVAKKLNISACSLWRYQIPGHELAGRKRYRMSEVLAYLESDEFKARSDELRAERKEQREARSAST